MAAGIPRPNNPKKAIPRNRRGKSWDFIEPVVARFCWVGNIFEGGWQVSPVPRRVNPLANFLRFREPPGIPKEKKNKERGALSRQGAATTKRFPAFR